MNRAKTLVSGCIFIASIISCVASEALIDDIVWEADAKTIINSGGSLYASINATTVTYVFIGVAGLIALGYILFTLTTSDGGLPFASKQGQHYYDPTTDVAVDEALAYAAADLQNTNTSQEYRRKRSALQQNMVTKMLQLEQIFKKYEVEEDECRAYIACEAANVERLAENGPIVQQAHELFSAMNKPEHLIKMKGNKSMMIMKQAYDSAKTRQQEVDVCAPLRNACSALRQKTN